MMDTTTIIYLVAALIATIVTGVAVWIIYLYCKKRRIEQERIADQLNSEYEVRYQRWRGTSSRPAPKV